MVLQGEEAEKATLPTLDDITVSIADCPEFRHVYAYLNQGKLPEEDTLARRIVLEAQDYVLRDGVLYHLYTPQTKRINRALAVIEQVCVPTRYRKVVAEQLHYPMHIGFDRLYSTVRSRFYWPGMYVFLHQYITSCLDCQRCKRWVHQGKTPVGANLISTPLTRWNVDFHGPYPMSEGKKYILVFICCTSGWPEVVATADTSAETVVRELFNCIISRYGVCRGITLQSDNGSGFIAKLTKLYLKHLV
jgi:hypothetical protein